MNALDSIAAYYLYETERYDRTISSVRSPFSRCAVPTTPEQGRLMKAYAHKVMTHVQNMATELGFRPGAVSRKISTLGRYTHEELKDCFLTEYWQELDKRLCRPESLAFMTGAPEGKA